MENQFSIQNVIATDLNIILKLFQDTIQSICIKDYTKAQIAVWISSVEDEERWREAIEEQFFIVAEQSDKIIGFASLKDDNYIDFLYVHKDYQRKGIASLLFKTLQEEAKRQKQNTLWSHVSKTARPFFEGKEFEVIQENNKEVKGVELMNYWMRKNLGTKR